jgi:hypothetical protein
MAARLASLAATAAAALALSGCYPLFNHEFSPIGSPYDPPPGGHDIGANPGSAGSSAGQRFTGRAEGQLASRMKLTDYSVKTKSTWARFIGSYTSSLEGSPLSSADWHGKFKTVRNRKTGKFRIKGLVLSTFDDATAGRACLRLGYGGKRKQNRRPRKRGRGVFKMLGGEGGAETLYGKAIVRVKLTRANKMRFRGRVTQRQGAERGFTPACTRLERKFGLTPLTD